MTKNITALEISQGDTIEDSNGHRYEDVFVEQSDDDGQTFVVVYGTDNAVKLGLSQYVYLIDKLMEGN